jgi:MipA family protein
MLPKAILSFFILFYQLTVCAQEPESKWQLSLALGAGVRTNPVLDNRDIPLIVIPQISYQGDHLFIQNLDFGYTFYQNERQQVSLIVTPSYDQVFFNRSDIGNIIINSTSSNLGPNGDTTNLGNNNLLPDGDNHIVDGPRIGGKSPTILVSDSGRRRMAGLAGLEYSLLVADIDFQLQALQEFTQYYDGQELRAAMSKNISAGKHNFKFTLGANWQSDKTLEYFYGVTTRSGTSLVTYVPEAGVSGLLRIDWNYQINSHWSLQLLGSYRRLSKSVTESPIISDKNVVTAFAGGVYHF